MKDDEFEVFFAGGGFGGFGAQETIVLAHNAEGLFFRSDDSLSAHGDRNVIHEGLRGNEAAGIFDVLLVDGGFLTAIVGEEVGDFERDKFALEEAIAWAAREEMEAEVN